MSLASDHAVETPHGGPASSQSEIAGRSLTQIAWGRLRRDKVAMVSMIVVVFILAAAAFAPLITKLLGVDPYSFHNDVKEGIISDWAACPTGQVGRHQPARTRSASSPAPAATSSPGCSTARASRCSSRSRRPSSRWSWASRSASSPATPRAGWTPLSAG